MALSQFPVLPGIGWDIKKVPVTSTRILTAASGVEYRAQNWQNNRWRFLIPLNFLRQYGSYVEYTTITGFILSMAGSFQNWIYNDPFDNTATSQNIGIGDGTTVAFPLVRSIGGYTEPVNYANVLSNVYLNGVLQEPTTYTLSQTGSFGPDTVLFNSAPGSNVVVSADFTFYFVCRFLSDEPEFKNFINARWQNDGIEFESVK